MRWFLFLVVFVILFFLLRSSIPATAVAVSINVPPDFSTDSIIEITRILDSHGANATFFVTGLWASNNSNISRILASEYELGCFTTSGARLSMIPDENVSFEVAYCEDLLENITGVDIVSFRAPYGEVRKSLFNGSGFVYDSSIVSPYSWFWEDPGVAEVPVSSVFLVPLSPYGLKLLGDFWFFLARKARGDVIISINAGDVLAYRTDFDYLLASYDSRGVPLLTVSSLGGR